MSQSMRNIINLVNPSETINIKFWKWFGNSKIVDNGEPLICYHGSSESNLQFFDINKVGYNKGNYGHYGYGFYFSTDIKEAKTYGPNIYECYIQMINPFTGIDDELIQVKEAGLDTIDDLIPISIDFESFKNAFKKDKNIFDFVSNIEKFGLEKAWNIVKVKGISLDSDLLNDIGDILEYSTLNREVHGVPDYILNKLDDLNIKVNLNKGFPYHQALHWITDLGNRSEEFTNIVKSLGYDGVWYGSEIVAFDAHQIKSIYNDGSWDANDKSVHS